MLEFPDEGGLFPLFGAESRAGKFIAIMGGIVGPRSEVLEIPIGIDGDTFFEGLDMLIELDNVFFLIAYDFVFFAEFRHVGHEFAFHFHKNRVFAVDSFHELGLFLLQLDLSFLHLFHLFF